jgi:Polyketide cyclase / dehydrase and lipid transport
VSVRREGDAPLAVGARRRDPPARSPRGGDDLGAHRAESPQRLVVRGVDGPVRAISRWTIEPLGDGERSRLTGTVDFEGHGIGKLLIPLVVRRQVRVEMPRNLQKLKQRLESSTWVLRPTGSA